MAEESSPRRSRRAYLTALALGTGAFAGCSDERQRTASPDSDPGPSRTTDDSTGTETSAPVLDGQPCIAHYMTGMVPFRDAEPYWTDPRYYDPNGPTSNVGGAMLHAAVPALLNRSDDPEQPVDQSIDDAVRQELRAASRFGVDTFEFYYPWTGDTAILDQYDEIIEAFFRVAAATEIPFEFTIAISHPIAGTADRKVEALGEHVSGLLASVETDRWLQTPDGRFVVGTWLPDALALGADHTRTASDPSLLGDVAAAYDALADRTGADIAWLYDLHYASDATDLQAYVDAALDHFPAIHGWHTGCVDETVWEYVATQCRERDRAFVQDTHGDLATGKFYTTGPGSEAIFSADRATSVCPDEVERWTVELGLSENFRTQLGAAARREADGVYLSTWNDYGEGHHVAPEINHNFAFAQLLQYGLARWRGEPDSGPGEVAMVFFEKYPSDVTPSPFDLGARTETCLDSSDRIEVVTILDDPATLRVNDGAPQPVEAGLTATSVPMVPGHVDVTVTRGESVVATLRTPEAITEDPFRSDRLTFAYSSAHDAIYSDLYGEDAPVYVSNQYARDDLVDGPNYGRPTDLAGDVC